MLQSVRFLHFLRSLRSECHGLALGPRQGTWEGMQGKCQAGHLHAVGLMIGGKPTLVTGLITFGLHPASHLQGGVDSSLCLSDPTDWEHPCLWKPSAAVCGPSWNCHPHSGSAGRDGGRLDTGQGTSQAQQRIS